MTGYIGTIMNRKPVLFLNGALARTLSSQDARTCVVGGNKVAVTFATGKVSVFDVNGSPIREFVLPDNKRAVQASFHKDNELAIISEDGITYLYSVFGSIIRVF